MFFKKNAVEKPRPKKILVVDDQQDILNLITGLLERRGYEVITARDGSGCLDVVQKEHPDLILLDNVMPNMDGPTTLKKLKESSQTAGIPVIMVTALTEDKNISIAQKDGAAAYIVKPFDHSVLLEKINQILRFGSKRRV